MLLSLLKRAYRRLPVIRELDALNRSISSAVNRQNWLLAEIYRQMLTKDSARYHDRRRILYAESQCCSQNGEDGILHELFVRIGATNRVFFEIGTSNNTALLAAAGWKGFWVDGQDAVASHIAASPSMSQAITFRQAFITAENIGTLINDLGIPRELDLLSIDIDQNTYHVWDAIDGLKPRVVVVEYNASVPPWLDWVCEYQPDRSWDGTVNFGASLKAFERLGREKGYALVGCDSAGVNAYFVRSDLADGERFCQPFTADNHYEPPRYPLSERGGHSEGPLDIPMQRA
jgi:hypothetical protein